ncbi:hypothetical protein C359_05128 [Cryptococcus neoformans Bt120]|nr:hypothetical protein C360_06790 [Cryptococcus neoformans var. grubii Bt15]OXG37749.1 hypothetical protein C359_05128 [Cryptococcus neoformans var. grubii Bt120]
MFSYLWTLSHRSIGCPSPAQHSNSDQLFDNQSTSNSRDYPLIRALFQTIYSKGCFAALHSRPTPSNHFSTFFTTLFKFIYDHPIMSASILALSGGAVARPSAFRRLTTTTTSRLSRGFAGTASTAGISSIPSMFNASKSGPHLGELGKLAELAEMVGSLKTGQEEMINAMKNLSTEIEAQKEVMREKRIYVLDTAKEEGEFGMVDNAGKVKLTTLENDQFHFLDRVFHEPIQMIEKIGGIKTVNEPAFVILAPTSEQLLELAHDGILQTPAIIRMCETHLSSSLPELLDAGETFKAQIRLIAGEIANVAVDGQVFSAEYDDGTRVNFLTEYNGSMTDPRFDDYFAMKGEEATEYAELYAQYREDNFHTADVGEEPTLSTHSLDDPDQPNWLQSHFDQNAYIYSAPAEKIDHNEILEVVNAPSYNVRFYFHSPVKGPCTRDGWQTWTMRMQVDEDEAADTEIFGGDVMTFNCPVCWQADLPFKLNLSGTVLDIETDEDGPYFTLASQKTAAEDCEPQNVNWSAQLP